MAELLNKIISTDVDAHTCREVTKRLGDVTVSSIAHRNVDMQPVVVVIMGSTLVIFPEHAMLWTHSCCGKGHIPLGRMNDT